MAYRVSPTKDFLKELKPLLKRYASLRTEIEELGDQLRQDPTIGIGIGKSCYKIRLAIRSKGKGKSGGARVITCVVAVRETVYLLSIYDKSDHESLSSDRLKDLLNELGID